MMSVDFDVDIEMEEVIVMEKIFLFQSLLPRKVLMDEIVVDSVQMTVPHVKSSNWKQLEDIVQMPL